MGVEVDLSVGKAVGIAEVEAVVGHPETLEEVVDASK